MKFERGIYAEAWAQNCRLGYLVACAVLAAVFTHVFVDLAVHHRPEGQLVRRLLWLVFCVLLISDVFLVALISYRAHELVIRPASIDRLAPFRVLGFTALLVVVLITIMLPIPLFKAAVSIIIFDESPLEAQLTFHPVYALVFLAMMGVATLLSATLLPAYVARLRIDPLAAIRRGWHQAAYLASRLLAGPGLFYVVWALCYRYTANYLIDRGYFPPGRTVSDGGVQFVGLALALFNSMAGFYLMILIAVILSRAYLRAEAAKGAA